MRESYRAAPSNSTQNERAKHHAATLFGMLLGPPCPDTGQPPGCVEIRAPDAEIDRGTGHVVKSDYGRVVVGWFDNEADFLDALGRFKGASCYVSVTTLPRLKPCSFWTNPPIGELSAQGPDPILFRELLPRLVSLSSRRAAPDGSSTVVSTLGAIPAEWSVPSRDGTSSVDVFQQGRFLIPLPTAYILPKSKLIVLCPTDGLKPCGEKPT
jgi:hypothetical protein